MALSQSIVLVISFLLLSALPSRSLIGADVVACRLDPVDDVPQSRQIEEKGSYYRDLNIFHCKTTILSIGRNSHHSVRIGQSIGVEDRQRIDSPTQRVPLGGPFDHLLLERRRGHLRRDRHRRPVDPHGRPLHLRRHQHHGDAGGARRQRLQSRRLPAKFHHPYVDYPSVLEIRRCRERHSHHPVATGGPFIQ